MSSPAPPGRQPVRVVVFAREPVPGAVKTRLVPALGADGAAELHRDLVAHTLHVARAAAAAVELCCTPDADHPALGALAARYGVACVPQGGGDLGDRMARAVERATAEGDAAVLIGTDCPAMSAAYLRQAMEALATGAHAVIGPAADGGYVLIGLRRATPGLFAGIAWGGSTVRVEQCRRLADAGLTWTTLPELWDLDRPEDLERYDALRRRASGMVP